MLHVGVVAGESSGDQLGAALIRELRRREPDIRITGMAGPKMIAAGCEAIADIDELSVMGLVEVLRHYPRLRRLRERIFRYYRGARPDVFVGIDVPDFVLNIEARLHRENIKTVHYVAPQIWAWRQGRAKKLGTKVDTLLTLFPFEEKFFESHGVTTKFVGHPVADQIALEKNRDAARQQLDYSRGDTLIALMPGSRGQELRRHADLFLHAAHLLKSKYSSARFVLGAINDEAARFITQTAADRYRDLPLDIVVGDSHNVMAAADVALVASGTVTMEGLFAKVPMVVAYKLAPLSYQIMRRLIRIPHVAMPNVLASQQLIPEFLQAHATPEALADALIDWLENDDKVASFETKCVAMHSELKRGAAAEAAKHILAHAREQGG